jgi:hypothetical protein
MFAVKLDLEYFPKPPNMDRSSREHKKTEPGAQGVIEGCRMFDEFRAEIIASLPKNLPKEEFGKQLFEGIYGAPMEDFLSGRITDADLDR